MGATTVEQYFLEHKGTILDIFILQCNSAIIIYINILASTDSPVQICSNHGPLGQDGVIIYDESLHDDKEEMIFKNIIFNINN